MGVAQIPNPVPAFNSAGQDNVQQFSNVVLEIPVTATVAAGVLAAVTYSASTGLYTAATATTGTTGYLTGLTLDSASTTGQLIRVITYGVGTLRGGTTVAAGAVFSAGASGWAAAASTVIGSNCGIALQALTATTSGSVFIGKM